MSKIEEMSAEIPSEDVANATDESSLPESSESEYERFLSAGFTGTPLFRPSSSSYNALK